jgi:8-oxo-dGTP diphosphatase
MKCKKQIVVITGFVENKGKILLVQRHEPECPGAHLKWELPGGKISFDENPQVTIEREIKEETGYKVKTKILVPVIQTNTWHYKECIQHTIVLCYICKLNGGKLDKTDHHTNEVKWFSYNAIPWSQTLIGTKELIDNAMKI